MHVVFQIKSSCFKQQIIPPVCVVPCSNTTVFEQLAGAELCHPILVMFLVLPMRKNPFLCLLLLGRNPAWKRCMVV